MGCLSAKPEISDGAKYDKNHRRRKMFTFGIGIERGDITMSEHTQIGYVSGTVKKCDKINDENSNFTEAGVAEPGVLSANTDNG
jgi:hypothetical protein